MCPPTEAGQFCLELPPTLKNPLPHESLDSCKPLDARSLTRIATRLLYHASVPRRQSICLVYDRQQTSWTMDCVSAIDDVQLPLFLRSTENQTGPLLAG